jgi:Beta-lactamase
MAWRENAARSLTETFDGVFDSPGVVVAAACVDEAGAGIGVSPGDAPADGRFEIGSVTKTMTATLLALLAADGALSLDDEIGRWLSAGPNSAITLRQLATHTSGLPRLAPTMDLSTIDLANPYAGFGFERAEEGLRQATAAPGGPWLYSNFGYHLLGLVLERASGQSCTRRARRSAPRSPRRWRPRSRSRTAGARPWHGRCGRMASAYTTAGPAGSPRPSSSTRVAMLVSSGVGYSTALGRAGLLALAGDDPRPARPQPPGTMATWL